MLLVYLGLVVALAYLIGAVPIGALVAWFHRIDISQHGSGRTGMTNVLRTVGRRAAALVLLGDFLKGSIAVGAARLLAPVLIPGGTVSLLGVTISAVMLGAGLAALAAVAGHVWSIYLRLVQGKWGGGRGISPALGAAMVVSPWIVLAAAVVGIPTMIISRYVSLASILGSIASSLTVILLVVTGQLDQMGLLLVLLGVFLIAAHRDNIERLLKGTERKLGERVKV
ncbi:MAG TPA: glycerol-3-phosphate acyltransferase [Chloroflexia bacterium]|nr:glycerol-3-phosphate acyltransferase [Chloroflexia bacterium]